MKTMKLPSESGTPLVLSDRMNKVAIAAACTAVLGMAVLGGCVAVTAGEIPAPVDSSTSQAE